VKEKSRLTIRRRNEVQGIARLIENKLWEIHDLAKELPQRTNADPKYDRFRRDIDRVLEEVSSWRFR
jgi:hypothetical protein